MSDFKTSKEDYSQFILSWVIHHVNSISKAEIANIFGASDANGDRYMDFINKAKLFESVCKIGSKVDGICDLPFFELIKIDPYYIVPTNVRNKFLVKIKEIENYEQIVQKCGFNIDSEIYLGNIFEFAEESKISFEQLM